MRRILGNVLGYGTMGIVCLSVVIITAALLGFTVQFKKVLH